MKMVIIKNTDYLSATDAIIDRDEYRETMQNLERIKKEALDYLNDYIDYVNGHSNLHEREFI